MPTPSRYSRTASPTRSIPTSGATTYNQQQLPNVVKKLAVEGKAEKGSDGRGDGASIRMYIKVSAGEVGAVYECEDDSWDVLVFRLRSLSIV